MEEAVDLARKGWDAGIEQMAIEDAFSAQKYIKRKPALAGGSVNIGRYLGGKPDCMNTFSSDVKYGRPRVKIVVPLAYAARVSEADAMKFSIEILKLVNSYQRDHDVSLVGVFSSSHDKAVATVAGERIKIDYNEIVIKNFGERFVLNSIACAFHPCFFRRLYFKLLETTKYVDYGYGIGIAGRTWEAIAKEMYADSQDKTVIVHGLNDDRCRFRYKEDLNIILEPEI